MRRFAQLYQDLDSTTSTQRKTQAIVSYLGHAPAADAAWAVYFLGGGKLKRLVASAELRVLAMQRSGLAPWLFEECYQSVGDLAETIALLWPESSATRDEGLADWIATHLLVMQRPPVRARKQTTGQADTVPYATAEQSGATPDQRLVVLETALSGWDHATRFICLKLLTGGLRVGVSRQIVVRALAKHAGLAATEIAQRMMGYLSRASAVTPSQASPWPDAFQYAALIAPDSSQIRPGNTGLPYPFFLAHPWPVAPGESIKDQLGSHEEWIAEWKWDGIRAQIVRRAGQVWVWSRGEELVSEQFPDVCKQAMNLPDGTVIDGELLVWPRDQERPEPFASLQRRLGRQQVSARTMRERPVTVMAYDLLEHEGQDWRARPLTERRARLSQLLDACDQDPSGPAKPWLISTSVRLDDWSDLIRWQTRAREFAVEGLMLKSAHGQYGVGRTKTSGPWYKFKCDPMTVDAVLIYAQRGHGRRAGLYTDYTFGVWSAPPDDPQRTLVPVTKAYSGLSDAEIREVDAVIKKSTQQSFGPVRKVDPVLVFEIGFEGIALSSRHKSGIALRFSRMLRWRKDKPASEADHLFTLRALLP